MAHPPRKLEVPSVINFPSVFQFCHWHSFPFQLWKVLHFQVQRLSENVWGWRHQTPHLPPSWPVRSCYLITSRATPDSLVLYVIWQMGDPAVNLSPLFLHEHASCIFMLFFFSLTRVLLADSLKWPSNSQRLQFSLIWGRSKYLARTLSLFICRSI